MNLLFYIPEVEGLGERMIELAEKFRTAFPVDIYHVFRRLNNRFRRPVMEEVVTVLFLPHQDHLREILSIAPLLERSRVVILLPDHDPTTIAQGHLLRPRFLTFVDSPLDGLAAVLNKIGSNSRREGTG
jgi:hypothetical protein